MKKTKFFEQDNDHPIPNLDVIDINTVKKSGGSDLFIVIASPVASDQKSQKRLLRKIERYLEFLTTRDFLSESGHANPENTNIIIKIHAGSDKAVFDLLKKSKEWVRENGATLIIDTLA